MKYYFVIVLLFIGINSCKKGDTGPQGEQGQQGENGAPGPAGARGAAGNANVVQYNFGEHNFATSPFAQLGITTSQDTMNRSAWNVYMYTNVTNRWYAVPGDGRSGITNYRINLGYSGGKAQIYIEKIGAGELYNNIRVIRIYANNVMPGSRLPETYKLPDIDFSDYLAVKEYYQLPD